MSGHSGGARRSRKDLLLGAGLPLTSALTALLIASLVACPDDEPLREDTLSLCHDYRDNDQDQLTDCDDSSCRDFCTADGDADSDGDGDGDGDGDHDGDGAVIDGDYEYPFECTAASDCVIAMNFNVCCPCPIAMLRASVELGFCVLEAEGETERPQGCGGLCHPELCSPCGAVPADVTCEQGNCLPLYAGDCVPGETEGCPQGQICQLVDEKAMCVDDPNECHSSADCEASGYECRDWRLDGVLWCWHPDSTCAYHLQCHTNDFCEDSDGDGVYECVDGAPDCRPGADEGPHERDCPDDQLCVDPDGDGRGSCVAS